MSDTQETNQMSIDDLLNMATDLTENRMSYVNHARFSVGPNEVILDLYVVVPNPVRSEPPQAHRLQRVIMPIALAKDLATRLIEGTSRWEELAGINLPIIFDESGLEDGVTINEE